MAVEFANLKIRIPADQKRELRRIARERGVPMTRVVSSALEILTGLPDERRVRNRSYPND